MAKRNRVDDDQGRPVMAKDAKKVARAELSAAKLAVLTRSGAPSDAQLHRVSRAYQAVRDAKNGGR